MLLTLATALLTVLSTATRTDTTFQVQPGARLNVNNFGGEIVVAAWPKNAVRIEAEHSARAWVEISEAGPNIEVRASSRHGIPVRVDYTIAVPAWMPLILQGVYTDITVKGCKSEVSAETVKGEVHVEGGEGLVRASSVEGSVSVDGSRGRLELNAVNEGVSVIGAKGEILVNAINGDINLEDIQSVMVDVSTVNGDVFYLGGVENRGRYNFSTHNGDLVLGMPEGANATVNVATFNGEFESAFPVQLERTRRGKRFNFTLGKGSAIVNLESFEGTIKLQRPFELKQFVKLKLLERQKDMEKQMERDAEAAVEKRVEKEKERRRKR